MANTVRRDPFLFLAAVHAFLLSAPVLLFSLAGQLAKHPAIFLIFDSAQLAEVSGGLAKDFLEFSMVLVVAFSYCYWRMYVDGAHSVVIVPAGVGKIMVSFIMHRMWRMGHVRAGLVLFAVAPDTLLGLYFLFLWRSMGYPRFGGQDKMTDRDTLHKSDASKAVYDTPHKSDASKEA